MKTGRSSWKWLEQLRLALASRRHLMVEAGTGVGKSFAYLVPAIFFCSGT
jgi:ATP-dependent DNA helicase DinG